MKKESKITNEDIIVTMKKGFDNLERNTDKKIDILAKNTDKKIDDLARMIKNDVVDKMATKEDLHALENKVDKRFDKADENFREINMKLYDIDESVRRHSTRIERLEETVFEKS